MKDKRNKRHSHSGPAPKPAQAGRVVPSAADSPSGNAVPTGPNERPGSATIMPSAPIEDREPTAGSEYVPIWLVILFGLLFFWGQMYLDQHGGGFDAKVYEPYRDFAQVSNLRPKSSEEMVIAKGKARYEFLCSPCHQPHGNGTAGLAPPLAGSEWVLGSPNRLIRIPMLGLTGALKVKDQEWNQTMPALGPSMSDEEIAAVLTYVRQAWGNKAPGIKPPEVQAVRAEAGGRTDPATAEELQNIQ